jgi:hypothetical protein
VWLRLYDRVDFGRDHARDRVRLPADRYERSQDAQTAANPVAVEGFLAERLALHRRQISNAMRGVV